MKKIDPKSRTCFLEKFLMPVLLFSPSLGFSEETVFNTAKSHFQRIAGDSALIYCVIGGLLAIAIWAAWKGSIKTLVTCLVCSGLVAKFTSVVDWVINIFQKVG